MPPRRSRQGSEGYFGSYLYVTEGADGNLYATTGYGSTGYGEVVQIDPTTGANMAIVTGLDTDTLGQITSNATALYVRDGDSILEIPYRR